MGKKPTCKSIIFLWADKFSSWWTLDNIMLGTEFSTLKFFSTKRDVQYSKQKVWYIFIQSICPVCNIYHLKFNEPKWNLGKLNSRRLLVSGLLRMLRGRRALRCRTWFACSLCHGLLAARCFARSLLFAACCIPGFFMARQTRNSYDSFLPSTSSALSVSLAPRVSLTASAEFIATVTQAVKAAMTSPPASLLAAVATTTATASTIGIFAFRIRVVGAISYISCLFCELIVSLMARCGCHTIRLSESTQPLRSSPTGPWWTFSYLTFMLLVLDFAFPPLQLNRPPLLRQTVRSLPRLCANPGTKVVA